MKISLFAPLIASLALSAAACSGDDATTPAAGGTAAGGTAAGGTAAGGTAAGGAAAGGAAAGGAAAGGTAAGGTAAGGTAAGGAAAGGAAAVCDAPTEVFMLDGALGGCNGIACHIADNVATFPPDLISPGVAARLVDVVSTTLICPGEKLIDSANIENSLMLKKLTAAPGCGLQMPFGLAALSTAQVDCVRSWITSVAAQ